MVFETQSKVVNDPNREERLALKTIAPAAICETPVALVSIDDESRQWFKAKVGT